MQTNLSVVVLAKNEEANLERCLDSVKWCDEIIVVDDNSSDKTVEIAKKFKSTVFLHSLSRDFSAQRNFGLSKARNDWVLFVDSDEVISDALVYEISNAVTLKDQNLRNFNGFYMKRSDFMWGKQLKYGEVGNVRLLRLAKKGAGGWKGKAHERWEVDGLIGNLKNPILHFPHQNLEEFLREVNFYTDIRAEELKNSGRRVSVWEIFCYPLGKFAINYFWKKGFLDGIPGLLHAIIMSFHSFLARGKLFLSLERK